MYAAAYFAPTYFPARYFAPAGAPAGIVGYFADPYFARRYFAPRYFPRVRASVTGRVVLTRASASATLTTAAPSVDIIVEALP